MKKIATLIVLVLVIASFTSCKKDYTCTCVGTEMGTLTAPLQNTTNKIAKDDCDALQTLYRNGDATVNCDLN